MNRSHVGLGALLALVSCRQVAGIDDLAELDKQRRLEEAPCSTNLQCRDRFDDTFFCRASDARCAPLFSEECQEFSGDIRSDDAIILGSMEPATGANAATGRSLRTALGLAVEDFAAGARGLPPLKGSSVRRPLAVLHCDDQGQAARAVRAAEHLSKVVGVPAIVGATFSGVTLEVSQTTIRNDTLLISPSATSAAITSLTDGDLVWRTAPSDVVQAAAQVAMIAEAERTLRPQSGDTSLKLTAVFKGDAYGRGLTDSVLKAVSWNGRGALAVENRNFVFQHDYGDPNSTPSTERYDDAVSRTLAELPHLILIYGTSEAAEQILKPIEERWPSGVARPLFILADGGRSNELLSVIAAVDPSYQTRLAGRILGTEPGTLSYEQGAFQGRYSDRTAPSKEPIAFGAANAYDAVYLLAYATARSAQAAPSGADIAKALKDMLPVPGEESRSFPVGPNDITAVFRALADGKRVRLEGASGTMNFDLSTGDVLSDIVLWCPTIDAEGAVVLAPNGRTFQAGSGQIVVPQGTVTACGRATDSAL